MRLSRIGVAVVLAAAILLGLPAFAQTTGTIVGTIQDASNGNPVAGALVIAQSPELQGEQTALTNDDGTFRITLLPPGTYTLLVQADGYRPGERTGIAVAIDKTIRVTIQLVPEALKAEDVVVTAAAPVIDQGSTTTGAVIDEDFHTRVPTGRAFTSVLNVAAGTSGDATGVTFRGSSGPENNWIIDGVNTTDVAFGTVGTTLPNDFVKQVEVKTGGYQAEYGRSTGGVVNVVTKSGGNEFHGDVFVNFSSAALEAPEVEVKQNDQVISSKGRTDLNLDFGFDLGGYIIKDKLWFFVGLVPFRTSSTYTRRLFPRLLNADGTQMTRLEAGQVSADDPTAGDPAFALDPLEGATEAFNRSTLTLTRMAKLTYNLNENHSAQLSYYGNPGTSEGVQSGSLNGDPSFFSGTTESGAQDLSLRWTSKLLDKKLLVEAWYGLHTQRDVSLSPDPGVENDKPGDFEAQAAVHQYYYLDDSFAGLPGCEPVVDGDPTTSPCASKDYGTGPRWFQQNNSMTRHSFNLKATGFFDFFGEHAVKVGGDYEINSYTDSRGYKNKWANRVRQPGSTWYDYRRQALGRQDENGNFVPEEFLTTVGTTTSTALFIQDSYSPFEGLTINPGLRWEGQSVYGEATGFAFGIYDQWAPRIGAIYDWTGRGRSKVYANWGRFYEAIPLDINSRAFGGEVFGLEWYSNGPDGVPGTDDDVNMTPLVFGFDTYQLGGEGEFVVPALQGQFIDEYQAGVEYEVIPDLAVGVGLVHRELGNVIEDVSPDDGNTYIIANPGNQASIDASVKILEKQLEGLDPSSDEYADIQGKIELAKGVKAFPKPIRTYDAIELTARKNFSRNWYLVGSLTFSRTQGNYPGLFTPENGQLDPNITSQYDLPSLLTNREGPLRQDRPISFKLDGYYLWDFGLITGASFRAISGAPIDVLGAHELYGRREAFLLPRGSGGRTPPLFSLDLNLAYDIKVTDDVKVNVNLNVFNALNLQQAVDVDHEYTLDEVQPVVGGTLSDIEDADGNPTIKNINGQPVTKNKDWAKPEVSGARQAPRAIRLGLRVSF